MVREMSWRMVAIVYLVVVSIYLATGALLKVGGTSMITQRFFWIFSAPGLLLGALVTVPLRSIHNHHVRQLQQRVKRITHNDRTIE